MKTGLLLIRPNSKGVTDAGNLRRFMSHSKFSSIRSDTIYAAHCAHDVTY